MSHRRHMIIGLRCSPDEARAAETASKLAFSGGGNDIVLRFIDPEVVEVTGSESFYEAGEVMADAEHVDSLQAMPAALEVYPRLCEIAAETLSLNYYADRSSRITTQRVLLDMVASDHPLAPDSMANGRWWPE